MAATSDRKRHQHITYAVIFLAIVLAVLLIFFVRDYMRLRKAHLIGIREILLMTAINNRGPVTAADISFVSPWMTFGYLNQLFDLPPDYLQSELKISDPEYPNLSLASYASRDHIALAMFMGQVTAALENHFAPAPVAAPTTAPTQ